MRFCSVFSDIAGSLVDLGGRGLGKLVGDARSPSNLGKKGSILGLG